MIQNPAPGAPMPPILPPQDGFLFLDRIKFAMVFAAEQAASSCATCAPYIRDWMSGEGRRAL